MSRPNFKCPVNALQKIDRFYSKYLLIVFSSYFISNCPSMRARRYNFFKFYLNQLILICFNLNLIQAAEEMRSVDESIGSGKLYFTGTGYTVNLIPHAIVLGLLALGEPPPPPPSPPPPPHFQRRHFLKREQRRKNDCIGHWCEQWN